MSLLVSSAVWPARSKPLTLDHQGLSVICRPLAPLDVA